MRVGSGEVHVRVDGPAAGPAVVLLADSGDTGQVWDDVCARLHTSALRTFVPQSTGGLDVIGLIDALVYGTGQAYDQELLNTLITTSMLSPAWVQVDEASAGSSTEYSIQRCADGRRNGSRFGVWNVVTPGAANTIAACP